MPPLQQPSWLELSPEQKHILAPLASDWDSLEPYRKKKWLGISTRYPSMTAEEQARVQSNMRDWARLSSEERKAAREKFKNLKKSPPETQQAVRDKWQQYQELSDEEKDKLREAAKSRPVPKPGATKPVASPSPLNKPLAPTAKPTPAGTSTGGIANPAMPPPVAGQQ
ncbi:MAG: DUF3106 domain-containing protein [Rhodocyclaceae bacterium]|nr:DUF3106 domain-containing protein [Rhodocyclaceae bacterium]